MSFEQSRWLEKCFSFITQKRNEAKNAFEKDLQKLLNDAFYGKTMENVRNRVKKEFIRIADNGKFIEQQSKLTFFGIDKSCTNYDSYAFKQHEVVMDKPIYVRFAVLEILKLLIYETFYDKL